MNLSRRTSLSLLFVTLSTAPANAALSGDSGTDGISIEASANNAAVQPLDQLLGGGNNSDLFGSVLQQHAIAAQPAISTMDGHFGGSGAQQPTVFDQMSPTGQIVSGGQTMSSAPSTPSAEAPDLSLTVALHMGKSAQGESTPAAVATPSAPTQSGSYAPTIQEVINPVPLPTAAIMFASGLVAFPAMRRKRQEYW